MHKQLVAIAMLALVGLSSALDFESDPKLEWLYENYNLDPMETFEKLERTLNDLPGDESFSGQSKEDLLESLIDLSHQSADRCNAEYITRMTNLLPAWQSDLGRDIKRYVWEQKTELHDYCVENGFEIEGFVSLDDELKQDVSQLSESFDLAEGETHYERLARAAIDFMSEKSGLKLQEKGLFQSASSRAQIESLFQETLEPLCSSLTSKYSQSQYLFELDDGVAYDGLLAHWLKIVDYCKLMLHDRRDFVDSMESVLMRRKIASKYLDGSLTAKILSGRL